MARKNRSAVFDHTKVGVYHAFNRVVRRAFLQGVDPLTGTDYSHRRVWFRERMKFLLTWFSLDLLAYAVMSNHWHCVIRNRPDLVERMSNQEVAIRWLSITAKNPDSKQTGDVSDKELKKRRAKFEKQVVALAGDPVKMREIRKRLSDISWFVRLTCQTFAQQCNREDECTGRFFEERFKLERLETEAEVLACMAYVDLNPLKAGLADALDDPDAQVSIGDRLRTLDDQAIDIRTWLSPLELADEVDRLPVIVVNDVPLEEVARRRVELTKNLGCLPMTLDDYTKLLVHLALEARPELQVMLNITAEQLRGVIRMKGAVVDKELVRLQIGELSEHCNVALGRYARAALKRRKQNQQLANQPIEATSEPPQG